MREDVRHILLIDNLIGWTLAHAQILLVSEDTLSIIEHDDDKCCYSEGYCSISVSIGSRWADSACECQKMCAEFSGCNAFHYATFGVRDYLPPPIRSNITTPPPPTTATPRPLYAFPTPTEDGSNTTQFPTKLCSYLFDITIL